MDAAILTLVRLIDTLRTSPDEALHNAPAVRTDVRRPA
jgi:hypothetical protein